MMRVIQEPGDLATLSFKPALKYLETEKEDNEQPITGSNAQLNHAEQSQEPDELPLQGNSTPFPEGGIQAWTVVFGGFLCLFCSFGWMMCIGVFQSYYQTELLSRYDSSTIALIPSTQAFMMFFGAPVFGKIFDSYGPRPLLVGGTLAHVFGIMMTSLSREYYQVFLAQSIVSGLGASALFYAGNNAVSTWFSKRRALALGIVSSGSSIGGVVIPLLAQNMMPSVGFPWTMRTIGFVYFFLLVFANMTVRSRLEHIPTPFHPMEFVRPLMIRTPALVVVASFIFFLGVLIPYNFLILHARHEGLPRRLSANIVSVLNAASIPGRILPGYLGDRIGRFNVMICTAYLCTIFIFGLWIPAHDSNSLIAFACLYGFSSGAYVALIPALIAQICDVKEIGVRLGTNNLILSIAVLVGNPISGTLIGRDEAGYLNLQIFCGSSLLVGSCFFVAARSSESRTIRERI